MKKLLPLLFIAVIWACADDHQPQAGSVPNVVKEVDTMVNDLWIPWGLAFLPNNDLLFTERNGNFNLLRNGENTPILLGTRPVGLGEGGLLGVCIDPQYAFNHFVYVYETVEYDSTAYNRIVRFTYQNENLNEDRIIFDSIAANLYHNGGGIDFGPDGYLYVGTGDAGDPMSAQDKSSPLGKILRITREGAPAPGNPFGNFVWSYGHRNVQGFDWTSNGVMLATEHGPTADLTWCCHDELNRIEPGLNYGWPLVHPGEETDSLTPALAISGWDTWAPAGGLVVKGGQWGNWQNDFILCCLRGERMIRFEFTPDYRQVIAQHDTLWETYGRLRSLEQDGNGAIWFTTSNFGNDYLLRMHPAD